MARIIVCSTLLIGFIYGLTHLLRGLSHSMDFWSFMVLCFGGGAIMISLGFAWDRYERTRSRQ